jgi:hypothetical protein
VIQTSNEGVIPSVTKVTIINHDAENRAEGIPSVTKVTTIEQKNPQIKDSHPRKVVALVKLPDGRTVEKDSPEAQEFFRKIE